jgi:hypothetical protein
MSVSGAPFWTRMEKFERRGRRIKGGREGLRYKVREPQV